MMFFATTDLSTHTTNVPTADVPRAASGPVIDGKLDDAIWRQAPRYAMSLNQQEIHAGRRVAEPGYAQFAWDDRAMYLAVRMADGDVHTQATADGQKMWLLGDVTEWFLGPADGRFYWELHITPGGYRMAYFLPDEEPRSMQPLPFDAAAAICADGEQGLAAGWSAEFRITWERLREMDPTLGPDTAWRSLVGRYNINRTGPVREELTMWPAQTKTAFHQIGGHAPMRLLGR